MHLRVALVTAAVALAAFAPGPWQVGLGAEPATSTIQSFSGGAGWLNGPPLDPAQLRGKIVLVDFWEYTCLNCLRTLPYLREWYRRYRDDGFAIVGVHTPEFGFSGERANVAAAIERLDIGWPVVLDDSYAIWKRYGNTVWPHEYLYDRNGRLVESFEGEGGYQDTETRIQALLRSEQPSRKLPAVMALLPQDSYDKAGAVCYPHTAEILIRHRDIANATAQNDPARDTNYSIGSPPRDGAIELSGYWHLTRDAAVSGESGGYLALRYHAIQLVAVLKPERGGSTRIAVMQDGKPVPKQDAGKDLRYDASGSYVLVDAPRAYDLVMNSAYGSHEIELSPHGDGVGFYDFAFESCEIPQGAPPK
ncbi:MAG TPA: redoxin family protein [Candidatus Cybelea sp.]|nr:redoxin family protein [Candidatus Cybelea sp.]